MNIIEKISAYINEAAEYMITDLGKGYPIKLDIKMVDARGKETNILSRYGVWILSRGVARETIDTGDDLKKLQKKYNVPDNLVIKIGKGP